MPSVLHCQYDSQQLSNIIFCFFFPPRLSDNILGFFFIFNQKITLLSAADSYVKSEKKLFKLLPLLYLSYLLNPPNEQKINAAQAFLRAVIKATCTQATCFLRAVWTEI